MNKRRVLQILLAAMFVCPALGESVQLDLFTLGCTTLFDPNHSWTSDIDLGVEFSQIDHVYMDWAGQITAGLAVTWDDPENPFPLEVGIRASLGSNPWPRLTEVWGGEPNYPEPEPFDCLSEFGSSGSTWSDLLDGQGTLALSYKESVFGGSGRYIEPGSISLTSATLIVEGVVIPEPATITLLLIGAFAIRRKSFKKHSEYKTS